MHYDVIQLSKYIIWIMKLHCELMHKWFLLLFNIVWKWIDIVKKETDLSNSVGGMLIIKLCFNNPS